MVRSVLMASYCHLKVEEIISNSALKCSCTHLTSFAGGLLVPPNEIDLQKVYNELRSPEDASTFLVLATVLSCFFIYLVAILLARRFDSIDKAKVRQQLRISLHVACSLQIALLQLPKRKKDDTSEIGRKNDKRTD